MPLPPATLFSICSNTAAELMSSRAPQSVDRPIRRSDIEWVSLDGDAVLYDPVAHMLHRLNSEASAVWAACDGHATSEGIIGAIDKAFAGSREMIARDVEAVLNGFRRLGLLRQAPGEADADC
jgi:Coenzyme PQQ synthesis protein D (PqqD)